MQPEMILLSGDKRVSDSAIGENITVNLDYVYLDKQSLYSLDIIEFHSKLCDSQSLFTATIGMNEKCSKLHVAKSL